MFIDYKVYWSDESSRNREIFDEWIDIFFEI